MERNNKVNPDKWLAFYESKGWKIGKNSMKDWKAAVRTWEQRDDFDGAITNSKGKPIKPEVKIDWLDEYVQQQSQTK